MCSLCLSRHLQVRGKPPTVEGLSSQRTNRALLQQVQKRQLGNGWICKKKLIINHTAVFCPTLYLKTLTKSFTFCHGPNIMILLHTQSHYGYHATFKSIDLPKYNKVASLQNIFHHFTVNLMKDD